MEPSMFNTHAGTDAAMIGIWDAGTPGDDLRLRPFSEYFDAINADARDGKLLYVNTGGDGSYSVGIVVGRGQAPADLAAWYRPVERTLYLQAPTGRIVAGGLEDYRNSKPQITTDASVCDVGPGSYQVFAYQLTDDEERIDDEMASLVGDDALRYYYTRPDGCAPALVLVAAGLFASFVWSWWSMAIAVPLAVGYAVYRSYVNSRDETFIAVGKVIKAWDDQHPLFLFVLERVDHIQPSDGSIDISYESVDDDDFDDEP